jgi:alpha-amylase
MTKRITFLLLLASLLTACGPRTTPLPGTPVFTVTTLPTLTPEPTGSPYITPAWFRNAIVYEIFVRSFADSNGDGIGDLRGIEAHLDYLQSLHVNTLWLMPIYPSPSAHGYDVTDYLAVNPEYGTLGDLQSLVFAGHQRGMHIILDFVPSHLSNENPIFLDALGNPASKYSNWFVWTNVAHTKYAGFAGNEEMPRFNHYNPEVVDYLSKAALYWLDLNNDGNYTDGVDGFRIDNATFPPREFFVALRQRIKDANSNAVLLGEAWVHSPSDLNYYFADQFDSLFDFPLNELLLSGSEANNEGILSGNSYPALLDSLFQDESLFPNQAMPLRFLSDHDMNRLATKLGNDPARLRLAAAFLAALPGPIMIYYGEEIGMPGQKGGPPNWDNYRREPLDWYAVESGPGQTTWFTPADRWNKPNDGVSVQEEDKNPTSLLNFHRQLLQIRANSPIFEGGEFQILKLKASGSGAWGLVYQQGADWLIALYNFSDAPVDVTIPALPIDGRPVQELLAGTQIPTDEEGQPLTLTLPPVTAYWLSNAP